MKYEKHLVLKGPQLAQAASCPWSFLSNVFQDVRNVLEQLSGRWQRAGQSVIQNYDYLAPLIPG